MGAICVLDVPGTRRSGGVVWVVVKEICFPFVAGAGAGTMRDQGEALLHVFLLDTTRTATTAGRAWLMLLLLLLLRLLHVVRTSSVARCVRDSVGRQRDGKRLRMLLSTALAAMLGGLVGGSHRCMQRRELAHHALVGLLLVCVNRLRMLTKIVEARELLSAMTSERTFAGMLPVRGGRRGKGRMEWKEDGKPGTGTRNERRKGKEHGPNVPGQVFAPAKNHATIAIPTTLERFCRRGTIAPVYASAILLLRLGLDGAVLGEDEGGGDVSVGGVRGGVHG
jgi:hypothetical protein